MTPARNAEPGERFYVMGAPTRNGATGFAKQYIPLSCADLEKLGPASIVISTYAPLMLVEIDGIDNATCPTCGLKGQIVAQRWCWPLEGDIDTKQEEAERVSDDLIAARHIMDTTP